MSDSMLPSPERPASLSAETTSLCVLQRFFPHVLVQRQQASHSFADNHYCQFNSQVQLRCCLRGNRELPLNTLSLHVSDLDTISTQAASQALRKARYMGCAMVQVLQLWQSSMYLAGALAGMIASHVMPAIVNVARRCCLMHVSICIAVP